MNGPESEARNPVSEKTDQGNKRSTPPAAPPACENLPAKKLTPEEQMALYEDDLKENDWGHQPC